MRGLSGFFDFDFFLCFLADFEFDSGISISGLNFSGTGEGGLGLSGIASIDWAIAIRIDFLFCNSGSKIAGSEFFVGSEFFSTRSVLDSLFGNFLIMIENSRHLFSFLATAKSSFGISFTGGGGRAISSCFSSAMGKLLKA